MLECTPSNLYMEIEAAERFRDAHTTALRRLVKQLVGDAYDGSTFEDDHDFENHAYETLALGIPRIVLENPKVRVKTKRPGTQKLIAKAMRHAQNRWIKDVRLRELLIRIAGDYLIGWGVVMTTQKVQPGFDPRDTESRQRPRCTRLSPHRFFLDPWALEWGHSRYAGHKWVMDKDDLLNDPTYDKEAVQSLAADIGTEELHDRKGIADVPSRKEVVGYEVWVPEKQQPGFGPQDGFHGTVYTLAVGAATGEKDQEAYFLREPRPYFGPRWGPYTMFGVYAVPDRVYPLSPLVATHEQSDELNRHTRAAGKAMERYKRIVLYDAKNSDLGKKLRETPDSWVVPVTGFARDHVEVVEIGGLSAQQPTYLAMLRERLDRVSGLHDLQRGNVSSPSTATAASIADTGYTVRLAYIRNQFGSATRQILETAGWFMYHDDRVVFPLGEDAADDLNMEDPMFYGGRHDEDTGAEYDDLELEIEPYSMERTDEQMLQRRWFESTAMITQLAPMMPQLPYVDWRKILDKGGDVLNDPDFSGMIKFDLLEELMGMPLGPVEPSVEFSRFAPFPNRGGGGGGQPFSPGLSGQQTGASLGSGQRGAGSMMALPGSV